MPTFNIYICPHPVCIFPLGIHLFALLYCLQLTNHLTWLSGMVLFKICNLYYLDISTYCIDNSPFLYIHPSYVSLFLAVVSISKKRSKIPCMCTYICPFKLILKCNSKNIHTLRIKCRWEIPNSVKSVCLVPVSTWQQPMGTKPVPYRNDLFNILAKFYNHKCKFTS